MKNASVRTIPFGDLDEQLERQEAQEQEDQIEEPNKYIFAEDVQRVAARLISDYHGHLAEAKIAYLFKTEKWESKGKTVFGKAYKAPEQWRFMSGFELLVIINQSVWSWLDEKQKEALVDHELCHFEKGIDSKGNPKWSLVNHDVEEFAIVIARHGLWSTEAQKFYEAAKERQMSIDDMGDREE